jgi:hypothetical protein
MTSSPMSPSWTGACPAPQLDLGQPEAAQSTSRPRLAVLGPELLAKMGSRCRPGPPTNLTTPNCLDTPTSQSPPNL